MANNFGEVLKVTTDGNKTTETTQHGDTTIDVHKSGVPTTNDEWTELSSQIEEQFPDQNNPSSEDEYKAFVKWGNSDGSGKWEDHL